MNKAQAKKAAYENKSTTYGDLLKMLDNADLSTPSKVNPNLPKHMIIEIMRNGFNGKNPNDIVKTTHINFRDKLTLTGDGINMQNILRECS
ncbi:hypothetical protein [Vibrio furnissii]|uniref:hypothetical protein n=1 Tax=Vibrio furnissii TaxID=29494 RepID=UPI0020C1906D|nr:hypothetical protein [Vibrio furnissii]